MGPISLSSFFPLTSEKIHKGGSLQLIHETGHYPHFADDETEAQRCETISLGKGQNKDWESGCLAFTLSFLLLLGSHAC